MPIARPQPRYHALRLYAWLVCPICSNHVSRHVARRKHCAVEVEPRHAAIKRCQTACAAVAALLSLTGTAPVWLDGLLFDSALAVRARLNDAPHPATNVAVVAVDSASLNAPELANLPRAFFGPVWGRLITDLTGAGAKVVAFDFPETEEATP